MTVHLGPVAVVAAGPARALAVVLRHAARAGAFDPMAPGPRGEVLAAIADLETAGREAVFADARTQTVPVPPAAGSMTTEQVAALAGLTEARVRQLAPALGVKVGGRWRLDPDAVAEELERRRTA